MVWFCVFSLAIIGVSVAGMIYAADIVDGVSTMQCSFFALLNDIRNQPANTSQVWRGMQGIKAQLVQINENVQTNLINNIPITFTYAS